MPVDFTLPPDTRAVGTGNPPQDVDSIIDALTAMGGGSNVLNAAFAGGADPTGAADSTAAILAAITAMGAPATPPAAPGNGVLYFPPGTYKVSGEIAFTCSFIMSPSAVIQAAPGYTGVLASTPLGTRVNGLIFVGGTFDGNQTAKNCFWAHQMTNCVWYGGPRFQNAVQDDVIIGDPADSGLSYGNHFNDFLIYRTTFPVGSGYSCLWLTSFATDNWISKAQGGIREIGVRNDGGDNKFVNTHFTNGCLCCYLDTTGGNNIYLAPISDTPMPVAHASASATSGISTITDAAITAAHQGLPVTGAATTVAAGSNGGEISQVATWGGTFGGNGILDVAGIAGFTTSGTITVATSTTTATVTYTGISGSTLTGCAYVSGSATGTVSTGGVVTQVGIPVGNAYVGTVTPGVSFTLVNAAGVATNTTAAIAGITLVGVGFNLQGAGSKQIVASTFINANLAGATNGVCYGVVIGPSVPFANFSGGMNVTGNSSSFRWLQSFTGVLTNLNYQGLYESQVATANATATQSAGTMAIKKGTLSPFLSTQAITSAAAFTPNGNRDMVLVIPVATSASGTLTLTMGPSTGAENTVLTTVAVAVGQVITVHVPSAWKVVVTLVNCTLGTATITAL